MAARRAEARRGFLGAVVAERDVALDRARAAAPRPAPKPPPPGVETAITSPASISMSWSFERCGGTYVDAVADDLAPC